MQLEYRGLSRMGRSLLTTFGVAPSIRGYDTKKKDLVAAYGKKVGKMLKKNCGIVTWDNYCHIYEQDLLQVCQLQWLG